MNHSIYIYIFIETYFSNLEVGKLLYIYIVHPGFIHELKLNARNARNSMKLPGLQSQSRTCGNSY